MSKPLSATPSTVPNFDRKGLALRTARSSLWTQDLSKASLYAASSSPDRPAEMAACAASAAIMPLLIAAWLPLIRGTFTKPAESPRSTPPGK